MNKKQGIVIASLVHLILWVIFLFVSVIEKYTFQAPEMEPLDYALTMGLYKVFIIIAIAGIVNAAVLFLSLRAALLLPNTKHKKKRVAALCFSVAATILFYFSAVSLFTVNTDEIVLFPILWFMCVLCCGILLAFSVKNK